MPPARTASEVVVVGGGFAGLAATRVLARAGVEVVVVDRHNFHTFQPLLYQVATAGLEPADVAYPIRTIFGRDRHVTFRHGEVNRVDLDGHRVQLADGATLGYRHLVVATGAAATFFGVPGAQEHALPLYTLGDARRLRNHLLATLERAEAFPDRYDGGAPVFVVVGGGPTGVETAGALVELLDVSIRRDGFRLDRAGTRVVLVDAADRLLCAFGPPSGHYAAAELRRRGVELRLGTTVAAIRAVGGAEEDAGVEVELGDGSAIRAAQAVWAGGVSVAGTLAETIPAPPAAGARRQVGPDLSLAGHPEVFVVGDAAAVPWAPGRDRLCPQLAQVAIQSGRHAAGQILARRAGAPATPFRYRDKGIMATVGRRAAVAELPGGTSLSGTTGWLAWLGLHLVYLVGFRNRLLVLVNWCWRYLGWPSGPRLIVADTDTDPDSAPDP